MTAPAFAIRDLVRHYDVSAPMVERLISGTGRQILRAVDGVSLAIAAGETFALVGESGCGKSTIARCAVGLDRPTAGEVGSAAAGRVQMIFQDPYASLNPRWRAGRIIAEPIRARGAAGATIGARVDALIEEVGLSGADARKFPHQFSGGQRQRIAIARALAGDPDFLVCDEPTSALDVSVQAQILNLLKDLQRSRGLTMLFISHDLAVVRHVADRVGVMYLGRLCEVAETETLFANPRHPYTRMLLAAVPDIEKPNRDRRPAAGEVPNPIDPPSGCAFHPRCPYVIDECRVTRPELRLIDDVEVACHVAMDEKIDG